MDSVEWKSIIGYEGLYAISEYGWVLRLVSRNSKYPANMLVSMRINEGGYAQYFLRDIEGIRKLKMAHGLVARAFIGECPDGMEVNHKDGNKLNNHYSNLEYVTKSQNSQHAYDLGLKKPPKGIANGRSKLTDEQIQEIRLRYRDEDISHRKLAIEYGVSKNQIGNIVNEKQWRHVK